MNNYRAFIGSCVDFHLTQLSMIDMARISTAHPPNATRLLCTSIRVRIRPEEHTTECVCEFMRIQFVENVRVICLWH